MYIRYFGTQFSFHNIDTKKIALNIINFILNEIVKRDGIRLQPIVLELFNLTKEVMENNISDRCDIKHKFHTLIGEE